VRRAAKRKTLRVIMRDIEMYPKQILLAVIYITRQRSLELPNSRSRYVPPTSLSANAGTDCTMLCNENSKMNSTPWWSRSRVRNAYPNCLPGRIGGQRR